MIRWSVSWRWTSLLAPDPAPLTAALEADKRVVGACRHFAVLGCALLRYRGIAARVHCDRCGLLCPAR
ncbi:transglutaminase domain-containing protein [Amycolatopsis thailandensis]|uniref:transglutaminase domain-containing protein n=1 Tax=Amycolatopsis thailandensis TaxID=589330 RepID=UPI0036618BE3